MSTLTSDEAFQIVTTRKLSLRPTRDNLWIAETAAGTRLHREPQATPILAIESAEKTILATEQRQADSRNDHLMSILSGGKFYVRSRQEDNRTVFDAFLSNDSLIVRGRSTLAQAILDAQGIIDEQETGKAKRM